MFELLLIVCLSGQPDRCEEVHLADPAARGSITQCLFNGPKQAVRWAEEHPGYVVKKWRCGQPRA